jgi:hypothetical protein
MTKTQITLTEAQARALLFALDIGQLELEQTPQEEKSGSGLAHFERSIDCIREKLAAQGIVCS